VDVEGGELAAKMVENLIDSAVTAADNWHDEIMETAFKEKELGLDLEQIIKELEDEKGE
jgi:hypothetical protein